MRHTPTLVEGAKIGPLIREVTPPASLRVLRAVSQTRTDATSAMAGVSASDARVLRLVRPWHSHVAVQRNQRCMMGKAGRPSLVALRPSIVIPNQSSMDTPT